LELLLLIWHILHKSLELTFRNNCDDTKIFADEYSITMAISSLIDNAIKFTDKGSVNVILHKDKNDDLILDVKDTGIGIDKEYLDHIGRKKWGTEKPMMELGLVSQ